MASREDQAPARTRLVALKHRLTAGAILTFGLTWVLVLGHEVGQSAPLGSSRPAGWNAVRPTPSPSVPISTPVPATPIPATPPVVRSAAAAPVVRSAAS